ncbi:putative superoxide dismutase [Helianthus debilis subsp. tardiflorus]
MENLVAKMNAEGAAVQGSGWVWLAVDKELKRLVVETTANQVCTSFFTGRALQRCHMRNDNV